MGDRMQAFSREELHLIHDASMEILRDTGVVFRSKRATSLFASRGFKTDGSRVFFTEKDVSKGLETAPSRFKIHARNPVHDVYIGEDDFVFLPTGGAPNVVTVDGDLRRAAVKDYEDCCKLVHTSDQLDMNGFLMVQPADLPARSAYLDLMLLNMVMTDKAYGGAAMFAGTSVDTLKMSEIMWGGADVLREKAVMATVINSTSPLKYSAEEADAIIDYAEFRQPVVITNLVMGGATGPISLPGLLALASAEILAGLVLAQLAGPGTPVVYGSVSAPADMRTIISAVGAPEAVVVAAAVIQMARFYNLPCRTGGMLTNAHCLDAQAAAEGTLIMSTAVRNGANFIFHACGQLGSYISMSFEKWLLDEEVCRTLRRVLTSMQVNAESLDVETIKSIGSDGSYLRHRTTFEHCRDLYRPKLFTRDDYNKWKAAGGKPVNKAASEMLADRLAEYVKPPIDEGVEREMAEYVERRKAEIG